MYEQLIKYCQIITNNSSLHLDLFQHSWILLNQKERKLKNDEEKIKYFKTIAKNEWRNNYSSFNKSHKERVNTCEISPNISSTTDCFRKFLDSELPKMPDADKQLIYDFLKSGKINENKKNKIYYQFNKQKKILYERFIDFDCANF